MADTGSKSGGVIRWARPEDIEGIVAIAVRAWEPIFREREGVLGEDLMRRERGGRDWQEEKARQVRRHCEELPNCVLVTELNGQVVGFLTFHGKRESGVLEIGNNAVEPGCQGRGFGTAQYEYIIGWARDNGFAYAKVMTGLDDCHAPARAAYEKAGFDMAIPGIAYYKRL